MKRVKYLVWTMPAQILAMVAALSIILESCSIPVEITAHGKFVNVNYLYTPFLACGIMLVVGTAFSIFNFVQIGKISRILKERGYSI